MTAAHRRAVAALVPAVIVTGLNCGLSFTAPLANLADGIALGAPTWAACWGALTVGAWVAR